MRGSLPLALAAALLAGGCELSTGRLEQLELPAAGTRIFGTGADDLWLVPDDLRPELYHYDGDAWRQVTLPGQHAGRFAAGPPGTLWVVLLGSGQLVRVDASGAQVAAPSGLPDLQNSAIASFDGELIAVGGDPGGVVSAFRVSGDTATPIAAPPAPLGVLVMTAADEAWGADGNSAGIPLHFDGATWTPRPEAQGAMLLAGAIAFSGPDDVWMIGGQGSRDFATGFTNLVLHHWNGTRVLSFSVPPPQTAAYVSFGLVSAGPGVVDVIGARGQVFGDSTSSFLKVLVAHRFDGLRLVGMRDQAWCNQYGCALDGVNLVHTLADGSALIRWNGRAYRGDLGEP